ncbi:hypothetical protein NPX13_g6138 [Xylaria arbuscula]|uniref:Uncharacterized protein n=1 Tax=Xylaria arbuscula TaxID=114810 RepID=A0A9W8TLQ1_9PEZI|nr:hypothetical protein NPX13_g6138 [Xylaria arbuscula]
MWSKSVSQFLGTLFTLVVIVTTARADEALPGALVAILHSYSPRGRCHCAVKGGSLAVDASAAESCHQLPIGFQPQAVDTEDDWHVFLFDKYDCSDEGGWLFPRTAEDPKICNYQLGDARAFVVSHSAQSNHTKFRFGKRRGKVDQYCGT